MGEYLFPMMSLTQRLTLQTVRFSLPATFKLLGFQVLKVHCTPTIFYTIYVSYIVISLDKTPVHTNTNGKQFANIWQSLSTSFFLTNILQFSHIHSVFPPKRFSNNYLTKKKCARLQLASLETVAYHHSFLKNNLKFTRNLSNRFSHAFNSLDC